MSLSFHPLRISDVRQETEAAVSLAFAVPEEARARFAFVPGQYLTLRAMIGGEEVRRAYSICAGLDEGELRVAIKRVEGGRFSGFATTALRVGDMIEAMPPEGRFGSPLPGARVHLGIAAGSGITPVLSILRSRLVADAAADAILLYGNRATGDIMFRQALDDLKDRFLQRFSVTHVLSREAQDVPVLNGRLDGAKVAALLAGQVDPATIGQVYICGPAGLAEAVIPALTGLGVPEGAIQTERFTPAPGARRPAVSTAAAAPFATATIIHDGKTTTIPVAEDEPVLEAAMRAGLDLPWACRGGMCSTCRAKLTQGRAEMLENFSLEPWEVEAGYVLTCQAVPRGGHVTVDYDQV